MKRSNPAQHSDKIRNAPEDAKLVQMRDHNFSSIARVRACIDANSSLVLLRSDFQGHCSRSQLTRALNALIAEKSLVRIGRGLYAKTKRSSVTGQIIPAGSLETLATTALKRLGIEAGPGRAARAYNAGETTQLPGFYVAHTGRRRISRTIEVGGRTLIFEHD
jgi:hypothetical protein